jgi:putative inorganic carbon (HCO3(-)) transporter
VTDRSPSDDAQPSALRSLLHGRLGLPGGGATWTPGFCALIIYLWTIHSYTAPIGFLAVLVLLASLVFGGQRIRCPAPVLFFGLFLVWGTLGGLTSSYWPTVSDRLIDFWKVWLIFFGAVNVLRTPSQIRAFLIAYLGIFALYPVRGILFNIVTGQHHMGRYAWNFIFSNPNDFATLTLLMLGLTVVALQSATKSWQRTAAAVGVLILPLCVMFTQSRAGFLGLALFAVMLLLRTRPQLRLIALLVVVAGAVAFFAPPAVWERIGAMRQMSDASAHDRYTIWKVAVAIISDHPVFGIGAGAYPDAHFDYSLLRAEWANVQGKWSTHSTWLSVLAETGIPGLALYLGMLGSVFRRLALARRRLPAPFEEWRLDLRYLEAGLAGFMACASFGSYESLPFLYLYLGFAWVMAEIFEGETEEMAVSQSQQASLTPG